jgi:hypothetical protein
MTLEELAERIIGQEIVGMAFDHESETLTLELTNCDVDINGEEIDIKLFPLQKSSMN